MFSRESKVAFNALQAYVHVVTPGVTIYRLQESTKRDSRSHQLREWIVSLENKHGGCCVQARRLLKSVSRGPTQVCIDCPVVATPSFMLVVQQRIVNWTEVLQEAQVQGDGFLFSVLVCTNGRPDGIFLFLGDRVARTIVRRERFVAVHAITDFSRTIDRTFHHGLSLTFPEFENKRFEDSTREEDYSIPFLQAAEFSNRPIPRGSSVRR